MLQKTSNTALKQAYLTETWIILNVIFRMNAHKCILLKTSSNMIQDKGQDCCSKPVKKNLLA